MGLNPHHQDGLPFDGAAFFDHILERAQAGLWRLPEGNEATMRGPILRNAEPCLPGLCDPGDRVWFDPTLTPTHGNLVVVLWSPFVYERIADHFARQGLPAPARGATKLLRNPDMNTAPEGFEAHAAGWGAPWPDWLLCQSRGQMLLGDNIIVGTVTRIERNDNAIYC